MIGEVTDSGRLVMTWHGETVVDLPPASAADGPVYQRPAERGADQDALAADDPSALPRPADGAGLRADLLALICSPGLADKSWVTDQYDRYVRGDTVLAMPEDGGLLRVDDESGLGIALATDGNGRYCRLDPYLGTQLALCEAYRNVAVTGARPLAVTNCLNFGSPEDPAVMWQFAEAVRGLADGCAALGVPVTGGNVSFYNQTGTTAIHPTPVIGVLGVHDDVRRRLADRIPGRERRTRGAATIVLLGRTEAEFGGSAWAHVLTVTWAAVRRRPTWTPSGGWPACSPRRPPTGCWPPRTTCPTAGWPSRWRNPACGPAGCVVRLPGDPFTALFSESAGRVTWRSAREPRRPSMPCAPTMRCLARPSAPSAATAWSSRLFSIGLDELAAAHTRTLPALFG